MAGENAITWTGNLTADPELRYTPSGVPVANFTLASTPRVRDKATGDWRDGETSYMHVTVWRQQAEHVAETLTKGSRVVVTGRLEQQRYETRDGQQRDRYVLTAEDVALSLRFGAARPVAAQRSTTATPAGDPWQTPTATTDEPPF